MDFTLLTASGFAAYEDSRSFVPKFVVAVLAAIVLILTVFSTSETGAQFSSRFSLVLGEEYNDNIFFDKRNEDDFITSITPRLSIFYTPPAFPAHNLTFTIGPTGQIFARHGEENNFGKNLSAAAAYNFPYSQRLTFSLLDTFDLRGNTRTGGTGVDGFTTRARTPTQSPPPGAVDPLPTSQRLGDFISNGKTLSNWAWLQGSYLYSPVVTLSGSYANAYTAFLDAGGNEIAHSVGVRGAYKWGQQHNLYAGYSIGVFKSRGGDDSVVHNFDIGDDYFSSTQIKLTPTLTLSGSTGIAFNAGSRGPRIANNVNVVLEKIWQTASLDLGVSRGFTNSNGVSSGPSLTTSFFSNFTIRLTEHLTGTAGADFSLYDTDRVNFKTFLAYAGLQYPLTSWLCSNVRYSRRWRDSGSGSENTDLLTRGKVKSNSVLLTVSVDFDLWPTPGLARGSGCQFATPVFSEPGPRL